MTWDAAGYDERFGFVAAYGTGLLDLLDPQPGERVVDLGCGTGTLTAQISERGADVEGIDADPAMLERAAAAYPDLRLSRQTAQSFAVAEPVDAVFSNAVLHWVPSGDQAQVLQAVHRSLRPGGRFVAEMGGAGNTATVLAALDATLAGRGLGRLPAEPWCFPTPAEQATRLEAAGFRVRLLQHVDRPTALAPGDTIADWLTMFGTRLLSDLDPRQLADVLAEVDERCAPDLFETAANPTGWIVDYVRLRWLATAQ